MSRKHNLLTFSTLGCPAWTLDQILENAPRYGYDALELRGLHEHRELTDAPAFFPQNRAETLRRVQDAGLSIAGIGSSAYVTKAVTDSAILEHVRTHCELASDLAAPYVRVFGGALPADVPREESLPACAGALRSMGDIAASYGVGIVLETHDSFSTGASVAELLSLTNHLAVFSLWDFHHPYRQGESVEETFRFISPTMRHVHVKDSRLVDGKSQYCLPGEGDIPLMEMLKLVLDSGYTGAISVEWEKRWQPQIPDPEVALPAYATWLKAHSGR